MSARVALVQRVMEDHLFAWASTKEAAEGEGWRCRCGEEYRGEGALALGHQHRAERVVAALDEAAS